MALKVGDKVPDFTLYDTQKQQVSLKNLLTKKTVLAFYSGAFTGVCTKEMCAFRDQLSKLNDLDAHVAGISVDSPFANKGFAEKNNLTFPLLSDFTREVSKKYCGVYEDFSALKGYTASKRSVFVIDTDGTVLYAWISEDPGKEPPYEEIQKALS